MKKSNFKLLKALKFMSKNKISHFHLSNTFSNYFELNIQFKHHFATTFRSSTKKKMVLVYMDTFTIYMIMLAPCCRRDRCLGGWLAMFHGFDNPFAKKTSLDRVWVHQSKATSSNDCMSTFANHHICVDLQSSVHHIDSWNCPKIMHKSKHA
jgi:hypothetical protein